ncbi:MAG: ABC transporter ATP-binding protein [Deltaproteobacteria bacterium]|nr:ABC transporter ATP-binding protein [Deltaproteobacteria bacterium]
MLLKVEGLSKSFGALMAVHNVNLEVDEEEQVAIIGPNGAGKTTFFNLLTGYLPKDSGKVLFDGEDLTKLSSDQIIRKRVGRSFQIVNIYPETSVFESIQMTLIASRRKSYDLFSPAKKMYREETERILEAVGLTELKYVPGGSLSHGDKKRVEMGMVLALKPRLVLLDEPTAGMAPEETLATMALVKELAEKEHLTMIFTEHDMSVVFAWAKRIVVMYQGTIIADGQPEEIKGNPEVRKVYLGERR